MPAKPLAACMDAALPVGGTRGAAAHVADACGAAERTANGAVQVDNAGSTFEMDTIDDAIAPAPPSFISRRLSPLKSGRCSVREKAQRMRRGVWG